MKTDLAEEATSPTTHEKTWPGEVPKVQLPEMNVELNRKPLAQLSFEPKSDV